MWASQSVLIRQCSSESAPRPVFWSCVSVPFAASLGLADGFGSDSRAHVQKKGWLLVLRLCSIFSPHFPPLIPWDGEGLGQAAVLHVAGERACVLRGDLH